MDSKFKDFIISRCRELRGEESPGAKASDDHQWKSFFDVILKPNPELTPRQREAVALDYEMRDGFATTKVRCALLYYFEKRLRLDIEGKDRPAEKPVVIHNHDDFKRARDAAMP
jgi:hypothetical protein